MNIKSDKIVKLFYILCVGQFVVIFGYVVFFCNPRTQLHVALVGLSASCGLLLSGIVRRGYKDFKQYSDIKTTKREVDEIVKKIHEKPTD